jgi:putative lipase involved disintegration of autophagic bodies
MSDFNVDKDKYTVWPECKCKVHSGFQNCSVDVGDEVLAEVKRLAALYPDYAIKTTGHSLGGAIA